MKTAIINRTLLGLIVIEVLIGTSILWFFCSIVFSAGIFLLLHFSNSLSSTRPQTTYPKTTTGPQPSTNNDTLTESPATGKLYDLQELEETDMKSPKPRKRERKARKKPPPTQQPRTQPRTPTKRKMLKNINNNNNPLQLLDQPAINLDLYPVKAQHTKIIQDIKPMYISITPPPRQPSTSTSQPVSSKVIEKYIKKVAQIQKQYFVPKAEPKPTPEPKQEPNPTLKPTQEPNQKSQVLPTVTVPKPNSPNNEQTQDSPSAPVLQMPPPLVNSIEELRRDVKARQTFMNKQTELLKQPVSGKLKYPKPIVYSRILARNYKNTVRDILEIDQQNDRTEVNQAHYWTNISQGLITTLEKFVTKKRNLLPRIDVVYELACESQVFALFFHCDLCVRCSYTRGLSPTESTDVVAEMELVKLYVSILGLLQNKQPIDNKPHPFGGIEETWTILAVIVNGKLTNTTATAIDTLLDVSGYYLQFHYPAQFKKILDVLKKDILPELETVVDKHAKGSVAKLAHRIDGPSPTFERYEIIDDSK